MNIGVTINSYSQTNRQPQMYAMRLKLPTQLK